MLRIARVNSTIIIDPSDQIFSRAISTEHVGEQMKGPPLSLTLNRSSSASLSRQITGHFFGRSKSRR